MWATLLHDIGKAPTTKLRKEELLPTDHDKVEGINRKILKRVTPMKILLMK